MKSFSKEKILGRCVSKYLKSEGYLFQKEQVKFYDRAVDLLCSKSGLRKLVAVEYKLVKWRKALKQALIYQLCADYAYVALSKINYKSIDYGLFKENGVGLFFVSPVTGVELVLKPRQSKNLRVDYRKRFRQELLNKRMLCR
jgi:hypothetical protein